MHWQTTDLCNAEVTVSFAGVDFVLGEWLYADAGSLIISAEPLHA